MQTTVTIDDVQLAEAREASGIEETSALIRLALGRLIESEASRRLALLAGTDPDAWAAPRRRVAGFDQA